ncbi:MAG TPA: PilZ domain-containing protein [Acidiferrobacterales bacterium]|nr:PilZ domain-containing protein [Acidiferrobacterales bacterium]
MIARSFIRHPTDIPIEIRLEDQSCKHEPLRNVSRGGLCFLSPEAAPVGSNVVVRIALTSPPFEAACRVTWCQADGNAWQVGVEFLDQDILFRLRMVEQICHIEHYRRTVQESQGRSLNSHEAAIEWIERYAEAFPFSDANTDRPQDKQ